MLQDRQKITKQEVETAWKVMCPIGELLPAMLAAYFCQHASSTRNCEDPALRHTAGMTYAGDSMSRSESEQWLKVFYPDCPARHLRELVKDGVSLYMLLQLLVEQMPQVAACDQSTGLNAAADTIQSTRDKQFKYFRALTTASRLGLLCCCASKHQS